MSEESAAELERFRGELQLHCYRIVGSVQDAEDLVQETLLAAWRSHDRFEGRAALRTWLYRIATNRCLNAHRDRQRRPQTSPVPPDTPEPPTPTRLGEPLWLEPYPDALLAGVDLPESRYERREAIGLAFVAGLQRLPPRQRAALVLRDALGFSARETAHMLDTTETAANRLLARAREGLPPLERANAPLPASPKEQRLVDRFVHAFEAGDIAGVLATLTDDALLRMPPRAARIPRPCRDRPLSDHRSRRGQARTIPPRPHPRQRPARLRLLPRRPTRDHSERVRPHGPHPRQRPHHRDHRLPQHKRLPRVRPSTHDPNRLMADDEKLAARICLFPLRTSTPSADAG